MKIGLIGAPVDLGQERRGVDMGPSAIRIAHLKSRLEELGHAVVDYGNIPMSDMSTAVQGDRRIRYLDSVVAECEFLAKKVSLCLREKAPP